MKRLVNALVVLGVVVSLAQPASATPAIDGSIGVGEWVGSLFFGTDPNEGFQGDSWDIESFSVFKETGGGGLGDGLYFLFDTYAAPTFDGEPPFVSDESTFIVFLDFDGDSVVDQIILFNDLNVGEVNTPGGVGALGPDGVEIFVPDADLAGTLTASSQVAAVLDNGGLLAEDAIPDVGFLKSVIPEPTSSLLFGVGLLGAAGVRRSRRKRVARS